MPPQRTPCNGPQIEYHVLRADATSTHPQRKQSFTMTTEDQKAVPITYSNAVGALETSRWTDLDFFRSGAAIETALRVDARVQAGVQVLPSAGRRFQCAQIDATGPGQSGRAGARPLPHARRCAWPGIFGGKSGSTGTAVAANDIHKPGGRSRCRAAGPRQPHPVGAFGHLAAQCNAERRGRPGKQSQGSGLGSAGR